MPEDHMDELYNSKNRFVRFAHNKRLDNIIRGISPRLKIKNVLDAGCGEGHLLERLHMAEKNSRYYGIDITPVAIDHAKKRCPFANLKLGDLHETKYPDEFFDIIICTEVLEHIFDFESVLKEFGRILKPRGLLVITFPNESLTIIGRFFLGRNPIKVPDHVNSFSPSSMKKLVNMKVISQRSLPFRLLPFYISLGFMITFEK
ncbi:MAG: class I SAM-dependent methyltransferase [Candidatus Aenigmarchaeota archaeon]